MHQQITFAFDCNQHKELLASIEVQDSSSTSRSRQGCTIPNCFVCTNGVDYVFLKDFVQSGWHRRLIPIFTFLSRSNGREWQHLVKDVFQFAAEHWSALWPCGTHESPKDKSWRDNVKALLCRKKHMFESGKTVFNKRGYWRIIPQLSSQIVPANVVPCSQILEQSKNIHEEIEGTPEINEHENEEHFVQQQSNTSSVIGTTIELPPLMPMKEFSLSQVADELLRLGNFSSIPIVLNQGEKPNVWAAPLPEQLLRVVMDQQM